MPVLETPSEIIIKKFRKNGVLFPNGRTILLPYDFAILAVEMCIENDWVIYGIDGFFVFKNGKIQPSMAHSIDTSVFCKCDPLRHQRVMAYFKDFSKDTKMFFDLVTD